MQGRCKRETPAEYVAVDQDCACATDANPTGPSNACNAEPFPKCLEKDLRAWNQELPKLAIDPKFDLIQLSSTSTLCDNATEDLLRGNRQVIDPNASCHEHGIGHGRRYCCRDDLA